MRDTSILLSTCLLAVLVLAATILVAHDGDTPAPDAPAGRAPASRAATAPTAVLRDVTLAAGIRAGHGQGGEHLTGLDETLGAGACVFDYDGDGLADLFVLGGTGQMRHYGRTEWWQRHGGNTLYRNLGDWRFEDVTARAGLRSSMWGMGCAHADLDNDGDAELVLSRVGGHPVLYRNDGDGTFTDVSQHAGIAAGGGFSTGLALADYDADGLIDLYVVGFLAYDRTARTFEDAAGYADGLRFGFDPVLRDGAPNRLLRNLGGLRFADVTEASGTANAVGRGLAALWHDVDGDGRPDLLVANARDTPTSLLVNQGDGTFDERAEAFMINTTAGTHGLAVADLDNDGAAEILATAPSGRLVRVYRYQDPPAGRVTAREPAYVDVGREAGLADEQHAVAVSWGAAIADLNNDGHLDAYLARGLTVPDPDAPRIPLGQPDALYLGVGAGRLVPARAGSHPADALSSRAVVSGDFDRDGRIDLFVTQNNGLGQLLRNVSPAGGWLQVRLVGVSANRDALGARLELETSSGTLTRTIGANAGFLADAERMAHFGLGDGVPRTLRVRWPDGSVEEIRDLAVNRTVTVRQGSGIVAAAAVAAATPPTPGRAWPAWAAQSGHRAAMLAWPGWHAGELRDLVAAAASDPDPQLRRAAVGQAHRLSRAGWLEVATLATADPDPAVRTLAVGSLARLEDDASMRWLMRLFDDPSPQVRCALAAAFEALFREEEAMVVRKYLAVPELVRLLRDGEPRVRGCAARALGEAERYRALGPLVAALADVDDGVRADAVRSLGLLRERAALPAVREALRDARQPPTVRAAAAIALRRLDAPDLGGALAALLADDRARAADGLAVLRQIVTTPLDAAVIPRTLIADAVARWLQRALEAEISDSRTLVAAFELLHGADAAPGWLTAAAIDALPEASVRASAYRVLFARSADGDTMQAAVRTALADPAQAVRAAALGALDARRTQVSADALIAQLDAPATRALATRLLLRQPSHAGRDAVRDALAATREPQLALALIRELEHAGDPALVPAQWFEHPDAALRLAVLAHWLRAAPVTVELPAHVSLDGLGDDALEALAPLLAGRRERWARERVAGLLRGEGVAESVRAAYLRAVAEHGGRWSRALLLRVAQGGEGPSRQHALATLDPDWGDQVTAYLHRVRDDEAEPQAARFAAAAVLHAADRRAGG